MNEEKKVPWYVYYRLSPEETHKRAKPHQTTVFSPEEWKEFLQDKRDGGSINRMSNTTLRCPNCDGFLYRFYVTKESGIIKQAEADRRIYNLIAGFCCVFPCIKTYFFDIQTGKLMG